MDINVIIKKIMPIFLVVMIALTIVIFSTSGNKNNKKNSNTPSSSPMATTSLPKEKYNDRLVGVITAIDMVENELTMHSIKYDQKMIFYYNGATDIRNKFDSVIASSQLQIGQIVEVAYERETSKLIKIHEYKDAWEYKNLSNFRFRESGNVVLINNAKYKFTEGINITMDGTIIDKSKLIAGDEVTVRGVDNYVWSMVVTKGHGSVKFSNYEDLIDGKVMIGNFDAVELKADTIIDVTEGVYDVLVVKGAMRGEKMVTVRRNEVVTIDLGDIYLEAADSALVNFKISPSNCNLYIDGVRKSYSKAIELEYGEYDIEVQKEGYNGYSGVLIVNESGVNVSINLVKIEEDEENDTEKEDAENSSDSNEDEKDEESEDANDSKEENEKENSEETDDGGVG